MRCVPNGTSSSVSGVRPLHLPSSVTLAPDGVDRTITVPLTQGVHDYAFVVDGQQWVPDPYAPQINDGFGGTNSRLALLPPDAPQL